MSLCLVGLIRSIEGFPRVSGDEPDQAMKAYRFQEFSPRERG